MLDRRGALLSVWLSLIEGKVLTLLFQGFACRGKAQNDKTYQLIIYEPLNKKGGRPPEYFASKDLSM